MLSFLFSLILGKVALIGIGGALIIGAIALVMLGLKRAGVMVGIGAAAYIGLGIVWQDGASYGRGQERARWEAELLKEQQRQSAAIARATIAEQALARARAENEKLIDERQTKDAEDIAREFAEDNAAAPAPPSGTVLPCQCLDSERDVKRLRDALR